MTTFQDDLDISLHFDSEQNLWVLDIDGDKTFHAVFSEAQKAYDAAVNEEDEPVVGFGDHVPAFFNATPVGAYKNRQKAA